MSSQAATPPAEATPGIHRVFSPSDLDAIRAAAAEAERGTGGEVVSYVVGRCDHYEGACWRAATLAAVLATVLAGIVHDHLGAWGGQATVWLGLPAVAGALLGYATAWLIPPVRRAMIPLVEIDRRVRLRAEAAFLEEEVFQTRDRTGMLVFVALFEHRVVILGDSGINSQVQPAEWEDIAANLAHGIKEGRAAAALVEAIQACGRLLRERRVLRRDDDTDELANELRVRED